MLGSPIQVERKARRRERGPIYGPEVRDAIGLIARALRRRVTADTAAGLEIQELFAAFAANFVRWAAAWLHESNPTAPPPFDHPRPGVKQMVRIAANTSAWVIWQPEGCLLRFTDMSVFAGTELLIRGMAPIQPTLPLFKSCVFSAI